MQSNTGFQKSQWTLFNLLVGLSILWFIGVIMIFGFNEASIRINVRWSARFSLICFCLAFGSSAFNSFFDNAVSNYFLRNRRHLGLSFAIIHLIHLLFLVLLNHYFYKLFSVRSPYEVLLGGLAYVFIVLMLLTSFPKFSKLISKSAWNRLHTIGGYWILIVFTNGILGRIYFGEIEYLPLGVIIICVWILRFLAFRRKEIS